MTVHLKNNLINCLTADWGKSRWRFFSWDFFSLKFKACTALFVAPLHGYNWNPAPANCPQEPYHLSDYHYTWYCGKSQCSRVWCRLCKNKSLNEWPSETSFKKKFLPVTLLVGISKGWIHQPCRPCKPSTSPSCQQLEKSMQLGDQWKTLRFHTHANYAHLCWKATALARRPSDSIVFFFFFSS